MARSTTVSSCLVGSFQRLEDEGEAEDEEEVTEKAEDEFLAQLLFMMSLRFSPLLFGLV